MVQLSLTQILSQSDGEGPLSVFSAKSPKARFHLATCHQNSDVTDKYQSVSPDTNETYQSLTEKLTFLASAINFGPVPYDTEMYQAIQMHLECYFEL